MGELLFPAFHGEVRLDTETLRGISTSCFPVTQESCSFAMPSMAGRRSTEFGTDFIVFSTSWLSAVCFHLYMSWLNSNLWDPMGLKGSCSIMQETLITDVLAGDRRDCNDLFSVIFLFRALQTHEQMLETERPPKWHHPNRTEAT